MRMSRVARAQVRCYRELVEDEQWKVDHAEANACDEVEQLVEMGITIYDRLVKLDESWRSEVYSGRIPFAQETHDEIQSLFRVWLAVSNRVEADSVTLFEKKGYVVDRAPDLRRRIAEARWSQLPPSEAFDVDRMAAVRDAAIDEHEAGQAEEI